MIVPLSYSVLWYYAVCNMCYDMYGMLQLCYSILAHAICYSVPQYATGGVCTCLYFDGVSLAELSIAPKN